MSYRIKTAGNIAGVQALLDANHNQILVGYAINKEGIHCLIFKS